MNKTSYLLAHASWLDAAEAALEADDAEGALRLLREIVAPSARVRPDDAGRPRISTLGTRLPVCADCEHYERDPEPVDPGWPMTCGLCGLDMLEPYMTCPLFEAGTGAS